MREAVCATARPDACRDQANEQSSGSTPTGSTRPFTVSADGRRVPPGAATPPALRTDRALSSPAATATPGGDAPATAAPAAMPVDEARKVRRSNLLMSGAPDHPHRVEAGVAVV